MLERIVCTYCGADMELNLDHKSARCKYCNSEYQFKEEKGPALILGLNNAAGYLNRHDFDSAIVHYESILKEYPKDAEAAWGHAISTYGIVYEKDDRTGMMIPTCSRIVKESILDNSSYRLAIANCADGQRAIYEDGAAFIDRVQKKIKRAMEDEEDFDVFISFKSKDDNGIVTEDSVIARNIYDELKKRGIKAFFSEVTLRNRFGDEFEPIIYRALYSCKFFILVSTKEEYIEAPWVKNEWTRFRDRVMDEGLSGACAAVYKNFSAYSLPKIFRSQGIELDKHPFDYAQLIADNLAVKLGLDSKEKEALEEQKRLNAELEAKQRQMEEELRKLRAESKMAKEHFSAPTAETLDTVVKPLDSLNKKTSVNSVAESTLSREEQLALRKAKIMKERAESTARNRAAEAKIQAEAAERNKGRVTVPKENIDFVIDDGVLIKYKGTDAEEVVIPNGVRSIGERAFYNKNTIKRIVVSSEVVSICKESFAKCRSLEEIVIPDGVVEIGYEAFRDCVNLTRISIPESVKTIKGFAFSGCKKIENMVMPDSLNEIALSTFENCERLRSVQLPSNLTKIEGCAFYGCAHLERISLPITLKSIGYTAFSGCSSLKEIKIPKDVITVEFRAFEGCDNLLIYVENAENSKSWSEDWNPNNYEVRNIQEKAMKLNHQDISNDFEIRNGVFVKYNGKDEDIEIPEGVTVIGDNAFVACDKITKVTIPGTVTSIGKYAFAGCKSLKFISIPKAVSFVDEYAFAQCKSNNLRNSLKIFVENVESIQNWNKKWNFDNLEVYDKNGRLLRKNLFGIYK